MPLFGADLVTDPAEIARFADRFPSPVRLVILIRRGKYARAPGVGALDAKPGATSNADLDWRVGSEPLFDLVQKLVSASPTPPEHAAIYTNLHPIDVQEANRALTRRLVVSALDGQPVDPLPAYLSALRSNVARKDWTHLDVDTHERGPLEDFLSAHSIETSWSVQTHSGSHLGIPLAKAGRNYSVLTPENLAKFSTSRCPEPSLIPLPGTLQGRVVVRLDQ